MIEKVIEAIYWQDAYVSLKKLDKLIREPVGLTLTLGHVGKQDKKFFYISNYWDGVSNKWEDPWTVIPKSLVVKRIKLRGLPNKWKDYLTSVKT